MLISNGEKQWRKYVPTFTTVLGTYTMIDHFFVIETLDTNMKLGVNGLITVDKNTLKCEILQKVGEDEKDVQHQVIWYIHIHSFQEVYAQKQVEDFCSEGSDKSFHSHKQPTLGLDVSLHGGFPLGRPPNSRMIKSFSQHGASLKELVKEGSLGEASIVQRTFDGFKGQMIIF